MVFGSQEGAQVSEIIPDSPAEEVGLKPGDLIIEFNEIPIDTREKLRNYLCICEPETDVHLTINRDGEILRFFTKLGSDELSKKHCNLDSYKNSIVI